MADKKNSTPETIRVAHKPGAMFSNQYAGGAVVSGPQPDGMFQITFYADVVGLIEDVAERSGEYKNSTTYTMKEIRNERFREDRTAVTVTMDTLRSLREVIDERLRPVDNRDE